MVELITVIVLIGILGAIGAARFFDGETFSGRAYADQAKNLIRYAQKLAIAQNRPVFVRSTPAGFAVCFTTSCNTAANLASAPGGSNSGSTATRAACAQAGNYVVSWMCEGTPATVAVAGTPASGVFFFDPMGRPFNIIDPSKAIDPPNSASFAAPMTLSFTSGTSVFQFTVEAETGYVH
jgi:MSHA pilin protein MshC